MSNYKCKYSFTSEKGKSYSYGSKINSSEYNGLSYSEKYKFEEESSYSSSSNNLAMNIALGDITGSGMIGGLDGDIGTLI
jgi:hypothetical protein